MLPSADQLFKDADSYRTEAVSLWFVFVAKPFIVLVYCCLLLHMIIHIHKEELKWHLLQVDKCQNAPADNFSSHKNLIVSDKKKNTV